MRFLYALSLCCLAGSTMLSQPAPPPRSMVDVGHRRLHLDCSGSGSPAIVLEAGGNAYALDWALVQAPMARQTRVCSYDRAGLGWSDPGPADETVEQTVADLHAALSVAGEKGPYILTGASVGGAFIRAYQRAFPKEVAALVFTNSANHIGISAQGKVGLIWDLTEEQIRSAYPLPASAKGPEPGHEGEPFDRLPRALQDIRLGFDRNFWKSWDPTKTGPEMILSWHREFVREFEEGRSGRPPLGVLPVVVLSSSPIIGRAECEARTNAAACLDFLSSDTVHITAAGSGHEIHLYQPEKVLEALRLALAAVRNKVPLSQ